MAITVTCPGCHKKFVVSEKFAGKSGPCKYCSIWKGHYGARLGSGLEVAYNTFGNGLVVGGEFPYEEIS